MAVDRGLSSCELSGVEICCRYRTVGEGMVAIHAFLRPRHWSVLVLKVKEVSVGFEESSTWRQRWYTAYYELEKRACTSFLNV